MLELSDNHARHILNTFRYVDQLLDEAEHIMASGRVQSAFPRYVPDVTPVQCKVLADHFMELREALLAGLASLGLARGRPEISASRALQVQVVSADIALEDLNASSLRGYGALSDDAVEALRRVVTELRAQLERISAFLAEAPDADLQTRLERLAATTGEVELLRELERVVTAHGLVELRPALAMLVERMESRRFEVAVFGRVSCGKSSLLNHFLRRDVLPVGVTPITAIPTRISFGEEEQVIVEYAERPPETLSLARLAEVATERENPGNRKHVTQIRVRLPEPRLASGVTFVDTPGLGSLARAGAEETLAYLPRCDLGIVLVDAASTLGPQELAIVRALYQAGATAAVLLSKADLLTPAQRQQVAAYVKDMLASECGVDVPVSPVSVVGPEAALADEWFESQLLPLCQQQEEVAATALRRKVGALREAVLGALAYRLERARSPAAAAPPARAQEVARALASAAALVEPARRRCEALASGLEREVPGIVEDAANATVSRWSTSENHARIAEEELGRALGVRAAAVEARAVAELEALRDALQSALRMATAATAPEAGPTEPLRVAGMPALADTTLGGGLDLKGSVFALLGHGLLRRHVVSQLQRHFQGRLQEVLGFHRRRLAAWCQRMANELEKAYEAEAEALRARLAPRGALAAGRPAADPAALTHDLEMLSRWGRPGGGEPERSETGACGPPEA